MMWNSNEMVESYVVWFGKSNVLRKAIMFLLEKCETSKLLLLIMTRGSHNYDKEDYVIGVTPKFWLLQAVISFAVLLSLFLAPVAQYFIEEDKKDLRITLKELFTYVIVCALFKIIFVWMVYTTVRCRRRKQ